jgi:hypothetical protein
MAEPTRCRVNEPAFHGEPHGRARLEAYRWLFWFGTDYIHNLDRYLGVRQEDLTRADIADAWARLGQSFMAQWVPERDRPLPWAFERFGAPPS